MHREQLWFIVFCDSPGMSRLQILNLQCKSCGGWLHVATTSAQDSNRGISATRSLRGIVPSRLPKPRLAGTSHSVQISEQAEPKKFCVVRFQKVHGTRAETRLVQYIAHARSSSAVSIDSGNILSSLLLRLDGGS